VVASNTPTRILLEFVKNIQNCLFQKSQKISFLASFLGIFRTNSFEYLKKFLTEYELVGVLEATTSKLFITFGEFIKKKKN